MTELERLHSQADVTRDNIAAKKEYLANTWQSMVKEQEYLISILDSTISESDHTIECLKRDLTEAAVEYTNLQEEYNLLVAGIEPT